jgi:tRNA(adenine34) deaminase
VERDTNDEIRDTLMSEPASDERFLRECLREAEAAEQAGEVPVGAIVVQSGTIIGRGRNRSIAAHDPTGHAEIVALRAAAAAIGNYRLVDAELFVTVEPCLMCVGAVIHARLRAVIFGCTDAKAGALGGAFDVSGLPGLNHRFAIRGGVCESEARALLQRFFRARRDAS